MAGQGTRDEGTLSKGVLKMIFCRAVDLMGPEPYSRFCPIVCAALGISVVDGRAVPASETGETGGEPAPSAPAGEAD